MDNEAGSIMKFMYDAFPQKPVTTYTQEVPESFSVPSLYFPPPDGDGERATLTSYFENNSMYVKVFHSNSLLAGESARTVCDAIRSSRFAIPVYDDNGAKTNAYIRISDVNSRIVDRGVAQITVDWQSKQPYTHEEYQKINEFNISDGLKGE